MAENQSQGSKRPATERADELLNRVGWTAGLFASMIGMRLSRVAAYAREEAEDMWAEAQSIRRRNDGDDLSTAADGTAGGADEVRAEAEEDASEQRGAPAGGAATAMVTTAALPEEEREPRPEHSAAGSDEEPMAGDYVGAAGRGEDEAAVSSERDTAPEGEGEKRAEAGS